MSNGLTVLGPDGIRRSYDEHYDTMMDVEQDPTGAHQAIQRQHARIEELEDRLNFLIQPEMIVPSLSYRGWVIRDEDNGHYWQAYNYNWNAAEWESQDFISMAGNLDDVIEAIDIRIAELTGGKK